MKLLAIDTSTDACSVALHLDHEVIEAFTLAPRKHIESLKPMVEKILKEAGISLNDLDGLAFGCGPGSFAGLRIACSFIQGLSAALKIPVAAISTLQAMAFNVLESHPNALIIPSLNARLNEVYTAAYYFNKDKHMLRLSPDCVINADDFKLDLSLWGNDEINDEIIGIGDGWGLEPLKTIWMERFKPTLILPECHPRAGDIALLALKDFEANHTLMSDQIQPVYLRENVALDLEAQQALRDANALIQNK